MPICTTLGKHVNVTALGCMTTILTIVIDDSLPTSVVFSDGTGLKKDLIVLGATAAKTSLPSKQNIQSYISYKKELFLCMHHITRATPR